MPHFKTLDRYVLRRYLSIYTANLVSFTLLFVLIDLIGHLDQFAKRTQTAGEFLATCVKYYVAITPLIFCQILGPVVALSAALFAVTTMQRSNEFTPILATGQSYQRTFLSVLVASLVISGAVFVIQEYWIPGTVSAIHDAVESRDGPRKERHVKYLDQENGNLISFREYDRLGARAVGVDILPISPKGKNEVFIRAAAADWKQDAGHWVLQNGIEQEYDSNGHLVERETRADAPGSPKLYQLFTERVFKSTLRPGDIEQRKDEAIYMTLGELKRKAETSPDQSGWYVKYFSRFAYPATNFVLVLLGLPVIVHFGNKNIFFGALLALAISTAYLVSNSVFQDFGIQGLLPVRVGAGLAPILFTALGATLYRQMKS
ncbi:MAG TPA: LptF/LptG family permease [Planctomycetota bacterium]|nr:LptF/LptG family permease [Planctomycetota bacterium]